LLGGAPIEGTPMTDPSAMAANALRASDLLKALANPHRLLILCHLAEGEMSVGELEQLLNLRQPTLSQQLARLREDRLVDTRRAGKMIYYRLASNEARQLIQLLYELFCATDVEPPLAAVRARQRIE
jgi:ArsR family transcriptional regulator